jgi:SAM-dependent methyltransferase
MNPLKRAVQAVAHALPRDLRLRYADSRLGQLYSEYIIGYDNIYGKDFYQSRHFTPEVLRETETMAASIYRELKPKSAIDVGCGSGNLLQAFKRLGVERVLGTDFSVGAEALCKEAGLPFQRVDLRRRADREAVADIADVVTCFEVAEHLPERYARDLVRFLTRLAPAVCFTGAHEGQGGPGHYNERPRSYWLNLFRDEGYGYDQVTADRIRADWADFQAQPYLCKTFVLLRRQVRG